jgi:hypothetical protein
LQPLPHAAASLAFAAATLAVTKSPALAAVNFAGGVLIDVDHVFDFVQNKEMRKNPGKMLEGNSHLSAHRSFFVLHGFDVAALLLLILHAAGHPPAAWALYTGLVQHLVLDTIYNPVKSPFSYFLAFRIVKKFKTSDIFHLVDMKTWRKRGSSNR